MEGPPPADPSTLDNGSQTSTEPSQAPAQQASSAGRPTHASSNSLSSRQAASAVVQTATTTRKPPAHQLLSTSHSNQPARATAAARSALTPTPPPAQQQQQPKAPENDLFSLDFHAPPAAAASAQSQPKKDAKQDILSLFSKPAAAPQAAPAAFGQFAAAPQAQASPWAQSAPVQQRAQPTSMMGDNGSGMWGASSGWGAAAPVPPAQGNVWGNPAPAQQPMHAPPAGMNDLWGNSSSAAPAPVGGGLDLFSAPSAGAAPKKDDVFGDIWGSFK